MDKVNQQKAKLLTGARTQQRTQLGGQMTQHGQPLSIDILSKFQLRLTARRLRIKQGVQGQSKKL